MTNHVTRLTPPVRMTRVQPPDLDWTWAGWVVYRAELVLELYIQGRSVDEVSAVTGCSVADVQELVRTAGVERSARAEYEVAAWRRASRLMLARIVRTDLLYAWVAGHEPEDLAAKYGVPADVMWEVIDAELAHTSRRGLAYRPLDLPPIEPLPCTAVTCWYGCAKECAGPVAERLSPVHSWPPTARLSKAVTVSPDGQAAWTVLEAPPD